MSILFNRYYVPVLWSLLGSALVTTVAQAQSVTAADPLTTVQQTDNRYQIDGGGLSADSTTLFHSFTQFGLLTGESALFSNPAAVETVVGRVLGGDASMIDGQLAVEGTADLYLLNPAGILFGENAQLNLGGSFSASTATGLIFDDELFSTLGTNDFSLFRGVPEGYVFASGQAGTIVNTGNLAVNSEQSLTLIGGNTINTGQLLGGDVLVMAVPGENLIRLSQTGSLLGLELETLPAALAQPTAAFAASTLSALLTGANNLGMATDITVNPDGTVSLSGSSLQIPLEPGTAIVSGQIDTVDNFGGNIGILGDQIALIGAAVNASGAMAGGTVLVGGDQLGNGPVPNATATVIDTNSVIQADASDRGDGGKIVVWGTELLRISGQLSARGGTNGGDGGLIETSSLGLLDVSTTPNVTAPSGAGGLWLLAPANIRIVAGSGTNNISAINPFEVEGKTTDALLGVDLITAALTGGANVEVMTTGTTPGDGNIILETPLDYHQTDGGTLSFLAEGSIEIREDIFDSQPTVTTFEPTGGVFTILGDPDNLSLTLQATDQIIVSGNINTGDGALTIESAQGNVDISGELVTSSGDIAIRAPEGAVTISEPILTALLRQIGPTPTTVIPAGGDVTITGQDLISVNNISTSADNTSGDIFIESQASIQVGEIDTSNPVGSVGAELAGDVDLIALGDITFSSIDASSTVGSGGAVTIGSLLGLVRGIGTIAASSTTVLTDGGGSDGSVTIFHDGGSTNTPFDIGNAALNGTVGDILAGMTNLTDGSPGEPLKGSFRVGNIEIVTPETVEGPGEVDEGEEILAEAREILDNAECECIRIEPSTEVDPIVDIGLTRFFTDIGLVPSFTDIASIRSSTGIGSDRASTDTASTRASTDISSAPAFTDAASDPASTYTASDRSSTDTDSDPASTNTDSDRSSTPVSRENRRAVERHFSNLENQLTAEFADYLQLDSEVSADTVDLASAQRNLLTVQQKTGKKPALIYAVFGLDGATGSQGNVLTTSKSTDPLELLLITAEGDPVFVPLNVTRREVITMAQRFRRQVATPSRADRQDTTYLSAAQALYQWLVAPVQTQLVEQNIDTISFITDAGLRSVPMAALHDGENFIIQNYNVGLMPSLSLTDLTYQGLDNVSALVAGTSAFADQASLPGVPVELEAISSKWNSTLLRGETFNLDKLQNERQQNPYGIIHLATHGEFNVGDLSQSYLHLHNEKLGLDQLRDLDLHQPSVELLTLSACQTALGSRSAELGFAGFAVLAGAKTSVASLWNVSDEASAGLMIEFYRQLRTAQPIIKAEALRQAQLAMIQGNITVDNDQLKGLVESRKLPDELVIEGQQELRHPYYWAAFSLVGSPW